MKRFITTFKKVGGKEILKQYSRGHVLLYALFMSIMLGFDQKSLEILRLAVKNKLLKRSRKRARIFVESKKEDILLFEHRSDDNEEKKVWICWLQGFEAAPKIVKECISSVQRHINDRPIVIVTENNYRNYVTFPAAIQNKIDKGIISRTHMSDLLRLELLTRYGGTWIDATVYITGKCPNYMLDSDLFFFQNLKPGGSRHPTIMSNWFISANSGNHVLKLTLEMLYKYWKEHNTLIDYFIFHDFMQIALEAYPDEWNDVIPFSSATPHILIHKLFDTYDENVWNAVMEQTPVHKLTYKFSDEQAEKDGTYYKVLFGK